eukprot:XP_017948831.1 PREDICTED: uncharacterized protein LOC108647386 isoform X2 [Xenopus tropicalis]
MLTAVLLSSVGGPNDVSAPCDSPVPSTRSDTLGSPAPNYCFPFRADNAPFADWSVLVTCPVGTEHVTECRALIGSRRVKVMRGENMAAESLKRRFRPCSSGFGLRLPTRWASREDPLVWQPQQMADLTVNGHLKSRYVLLQI